MTLSATRSTFGRTVTVAALLKGARSLLKPTMKRKFEVI
jgi:hypothetical protein